MTKVKAAIGDEGIATIRDAMGRTNKGPMDALSQIVANAARDYREAGIVGDVEVILERKRIRGRLLLDRVIFRDYARGISQSKMESIPADMGKSDGAEDPTSGALYGSGHLSFLPYAQESLMQSFHEESGEVSSLRMFSHTIVANANENLEDLMEGREGVPGTDVIWSGIGEAYQQRAIRAAVVSLSLAEKHRGNLGKEINLKVIDMVDGEVIDVTELEREPYSGELIVEGTWDSKEILPVKAEIHYTPASRTEAKVVILHNGQDYGNMAESPFNDGIWSRSGLEGEITFDSAIANPGRNGVIFSGDEYQEWLRIVKPLEDEVARAVAAAEETHRDTVNSDMYKRVNRAVRDSVDEMELLYMPRSSSGGRRESIKTVVIKPEDLEAQIAKSEYDVVQVGEMLDYDLEAWIYQENGDTPIPNDLKPQILRLFPDLNTLKKRRHRRNGRSKGDDGDEEIGGIDEGVQAGIGPAGKGVKTKAIVSNPDGTRPPSRIPQIRYSLERMNPLFYSRFDRETAQVTINTAHDDYRRASQGTQMELTLYIARMISREIVNDQLFDQSPEVVTAALYRLNTLMERSIRNR